MAASLSAYWVKFFKEAGFPSDVATKHAVVFSKNSAYWVKFFKEAGFPSDVATRHAVVFSKNRIKPDMLADLDKPSLREMGITLMGDMISILRYAKKVIEKETCEKLLVDTEDNKTSRSDAQDKKIVVVKNAVVKAQKKPLEAISKAKVARDAVVKPITAAPAVVQNREKVPLAARVVGKSVEKAQKAPAEKRKRTVARAPTSESEGEITGEESDDDSEWDKTTSRRGATLFGKFSPAGSAVVRTKENARDDVAPKAKLNPSVFQRLGDSSVTSTTSVNEAMKPVFNITGLNSDALRKSFSVFNRLGDREASDGAANAQRIRREEAEEDDDDAEERPKVIRILATKRAISAKANAARAAPKTGGTMRADQEKSSKIASAGVKERVAIIRVKKRSIDAAARLAEPRTKIVRITKESVGGRMASERAESLPARERLGLEGLSTMKHVTFDPRVTYATTDKSGVFSRLGR